MPDLIGELNPDPHFPLEVVQGSGQYVCAAGGCTKHKYPTLPNRKAAVFLGGEQPGEGVVVNAPLSVTRNKVEYALSHYQKAKADGPPEAVYHAAEEMP